MKYCKKCGAMLNDEDNFCNICGTQTVNEISNPLVNNNSPEKTDESNVSDKSRAAAAILCFFLGGFGIHDFYLGNSSKGITKVILALTSFLGLPLIILLIWTLVDFIKILVGSEVDSQNKKVTKW